jgi:hypothetical protein
VKLSTFAQEKVHLLKLGMPLTRKSLRDDTHTHTHTHNTHTKHTHTHAAYTEVIER